MKLVPNKLPKRIRVLVQEIISGKSKTGKPGTVNTKSKTYLFLEVTYDEFVKRFEDWIKTQSK